MKGPLDFEDQVVLSRENIEILASAIGRVVVPGPGIYIDRLGYDKVVIGSKSRSSGGGGGTLYKCVIASSGIAATTLTCTNTELGTITVARPHLLRSETKTIAYPNGDSIDYTADATNPERKRSADDGASTETQLVTPMYYIGETIYAMEAATDITDVDYLDINVAGRQWAAE